MKGAGGVNFGIGDKVCFVYKAQIISGKVIYMQPFGHVEVLTENSSLYRCPLRKIFPVWKGEAFGRKQFNSLSGCLHSVGLRNLELSSRRMLEPLNGWGVFCFCVELKEVLENGIFRKDPYCEMVVKNFLDWAAHGFQKTGGAA